MRKKNALKYIIKNFIFLVQRKVKTFKINVVVKEQQNHSFTAVKIRRKKKKNNATKMFLKLNFSGERVLRSCQHEHGTSQERRYKRSHRRSPTSGRHKHSHAVHHSHRERDRDREKDRERDRQNHVSTTNHSTSSKHHKHRHSHSHERHRHRASRSKSQVCTLASLF